jgi:hypothetical protein
MPTSCSADGFVLAFIRADAVDDPGPQLLWSMLVVVLRRSLSPGVLGRRRNGVHAGRFVRPDERHTAGRVVHDEPRRAAQAMGTEP